MRNLLLAIGLLLIVLLALPFFLAAFGVNVEPDKTSSKSNWSPDIPDLKPQLGVDFTQPISPPHSFHS